MEIDKNSKILYIADVPVTIMYSGTTFMHRLFSGLHAKQLVIFQGDKLNVEGQLNVPYHYYDHKFKVLKFSRVKEVYILINLIVVHFIPGRLRRIVKKFRPDVIVTVSHGMLWVMAYRVSQRFNIPLVLIVHDDVNSHYKRKSLSGRFISRLFRLTYDSAKQRFCVSPKMRDEYARLFNKSAEVLYPLQGEPIQQTDVRLANIKTGIDVVYAGTLDIGVYSEMLVRLAKVLKKYGSRITIYSNYFPEMLKQESNIFYMGFVDANELLPVLQRTADVLFVPFPFYSKNNVHLAFPSKVADYTMTGRPLLFWAPSYSAIAEWYSSLNHKIGILIDEENPNNALESAILALQEEESREVWGKNAISVGKEYFDKSAQVDFFLRKINSITQSRSHL